MPTLNPTEDPDGWVLGATKDIQEYEPGDFLDLSDILVTATYPDGTVEDVTDEATVDASGVDMEKAGDYNIVITYDGLSYSIPITVSGTETVELVSIYAKKDKKSYTVGDDMDTSDVYVMARYSDGSVEDVTEDAEIDESDVDMEKAGSYKIKATYGGFTSTVTVTVKKAEQKPAPKTKKITKLKVTAKKGGKTIKVQTIKNAKVKITCNKGIFSKGKKTYQINMKSNKKVTVKLAKKLKPKMKIKVTVSRKGYKTKSVMVRVA